MNKCTYCGSSRKIQRDHVKPQSKGGVFTIPACAACNQSKGVKTVLSWLRWLKKNDQYRWRRIFNFNQRKRNPIAVTVRRVYEE